MKLRSAKVPLEFLRNMLRTPDVLHSALKSGIRKRLTAHLDYHLRKGTSAPFTQVDIKIVNACNLRCKMCPQWGESGYNLTKPTEEIREIVGLDTYKQLVDDLSSLRPWIYIWGGEPFLYPHLLPLVRYMKERRFTVSVVTNGTTLTADAEQLMDTGLDIVMVSIDGPRGTHDAIRRVRGAFDKSVAGIEAIQREKARLGRVKPYIAINATVSRDNVHDLDEVFRLGEAIRVDGIVVFYGYFQNETSAARHEAVMQEKLGTTPWSWKGYLLGYDTLDTTALVETVRRVHGRTWSFPYVFAPDLAYEDIPRYYREPAETFGYRTCIVPWSMIEIMPNGDVVTCRDYPDYVVGNIKDDTLLNLWNNERYQRFRAVLKSERLLPVCSRCCGLMDW